MEAFPRSEINIEVLENVKTRLFQLQESILFFLRSINPETTPSTVSWTELHSKFNVLIAKYLHLTNMLNAPLGNDLPSFTVFPNETPATDQQVQNLSVLLRTKLFPELEQEDEERTKEGGAMLPDSLKNHLAPQTGIDERRVLAVLKLKVALHDAVCHAADEIFENQRDMVHSRVRYESDEEENQTESPSSTRKKAKTHNDEVLQLDDFTSLDRIRYMSDWGGTLRDVDGLDPMASAIVSSTVIDGAKDDLQQQQQTAEDDLDDQRELAYFEELRRRLQAQAETDDEMDTDDIVMEEEDGYDSVFEDDESENESRPPVNTAAVPTNGGVTSLRGNNDDGKGEEDEEDEEDEDAFMEVSATPSQPLQDGSTPLATSSTAQEIYDGGEGNDDSGEEDMDEIM
ncbi:hypothetical protein BGZ83_009181 [Gryganskiella cystojenkinii]|nr:hypothetical protein BGZ83_009181 [Gryganskiella cystojenkinii]